MTNCNEKYIKALICLTYKGGKSLYGKAIAIRLNDGSAYLRSYDTIAMSIDADKKLHRHYDGWTATTGRHLQAFAGICKKEWDKLPVEKLELKVDQMLKNFIAGSSK